MIAKILLGIGLVISIVLVLAALQPDDFVLKRSVNIEASPEEIFPLVNDFHNWEGWSPWAKLDPNMKTVYEGPESGVGASYSWIGDSKVGEGKMLIKESTPPQSVVIQLDFIEPMKASNLTDFGFKPEGTGTQVTWTMTGKAPFTSKIVYLFVSLEKLVGPDFEKGLSQLKVLAESRKK